MLPPRQILVTGIALAGMGLFATTITFQPEAAIVGITLGGVIWLTTGLADGPKPIPATGYSFEAAMAMLQRATKGGFLLAGGLTAVGFTMWALERVPTTAAMMGVDTPRTTGLHVAALFGLGLMIVFLSITAACGLIVVTQQTRRAADETQDAAA